MEQAHVPDHVLAKIVLTAALLGIATRFSIARSRGEPSYVLVDDLVASGLRSHEGDVLRVHGFVGDHIERLYGDDMQHRFMLIRGGTGVRVRVSGPLPDTFREQAEVIVTGRLVDDDGWELEGTAVIAKCPTKYEGGPPRSLATRYR